MKHEDYSEEIISLLQKAMDLQNEQIEKLKKENEELKKKLNGEK